MSNYPGLPPGAAFGSAPSQLPPSTGWRRLVRYQLVLLSVLGILTTVVQAGMLHWLTAMVTGLVTAALLALAWRLTRTIRNVRAYEQWRIARGAPVLSRPYYNEWLALQRKQGPPAR